MTFAHGRVGSNGLPPNLSHLGQHLASVGRTVHHGIEIALSKHAISVGIARVERDRLLTVLTSANRMRSLPDAPTLVELFKNDLLAQENIDETDMFLALTNDDEDNIMAATSPV